MSWSRQLFISPTARRPPHKQDGPWAWLVLVCASTQVCLCVGVVRVFGVFLPVLMQELNESRWRIALVSSLCTGISLLLSAPSNWLCTRYGSRVIASVGHLVCILALVLSTLMHDVIPLYFAYSVTLAGGTILIFSSGISSTLKYFNKHRSLALGIYAAGAGVGVMTLPVFAQFLISTIGWRNTYRVLTGFYCASCPLSYVYDPNVERPPNARDEKDEDKEKLEGLKKMFDLSLWRIPRFTIATTSVAVATFGMYNAATHLVKYSEEIGISADQASTLYTFLGLTSIGGRIIAGRLSDHPRVDPKYLNMGAQCLGAICMILLTRTTSYTHLVVFSLFYGVAEGSFRTTMNVLLATSVSPSQASSAWGMGTSFTSIFHATGPTIAGLMADRSGSYLSAFYMSGGVLFFATTIHLVSLCFKRPASELESVEGREQVDAGSGTKEAYENTAMYSSDQEGITRL